MYFKYLTPFMKSILYITFAIFSTLSWTQNKELFKQANALYNAGDYQNAITQYEAILNTNKHSAEVYFNLANSHYKLNHIAPSIYYYEKALQLNPNDNDIKNNLAFAKNMTIDSIDTIPEVGFSKFIKTIANSLSFDGWAILVVILMLGFVVLFLVYYFAQFTTYKRFAFIGSIASLFLMIMALGLAFHSYNLHQLDNPAIIFAQESQIKTEPNLRSELAFVLHEGTKVQVMDTIDNWKKIKLTDGKIGWVLKDDVKLLN